MDKEVVAHIDSGIFTFESVLMWWLNLEPVIQNEVNQREKDKYIKLDDISICLQKK